MNALIPVEFVRPTPELIAGNFTASSPPVYFTLTSSMLCFIVLGCVYTVLNDKYR